MKSLTKAAVDAGCLKWQNGYTYIYDLFLHPLRLRGNVDLLEIGLCAGGPEVSGDVDRIISNAPSLAMWLDYFPTGTVTGFDISDFSGFEVPRFKFFRGDSGSVEDLTNLKLTGQKFDFILDDASHASFHQQLMLAELFETVKPGGLYIIEDLNWIPQEYENTLPKVARTYNVLSDFVKNGCFTPSAAISQSAADRLASDIEGVLLIDSGYLETLRRSTTKRQGLEIPEAGKGKGWRRKKAFGRMLDPYFWRFLSRQVASAFTGDEFNARQYMQVAVIQKKVSPGEKI